MKSHVEHERLLVDGLSISLRIYVEDLQLFVRLKQPTCNHSFAFELFIVFVVLGSFHNVCDHKAVDLERILACFSLFTRKNFDLLTKTIIWLRWVASEVE